MDARDPRTVGAYREQIVERLFATMMGARFSELAQKPDAPFVGAGAGRGGFVRRRTLSRLAPVVKGDAIEKAFEALFTETERAGRFGFTPGELERVKSNIMTGLERSVKEKENTPAAAIAGELVRHVTVREPVPGIVYEYELHRRFLPEITLAEVNALAKDLGSRPQPCDHGERSGEDQVSPCPTRRSSSSVVASIGGKSITAYVDTIDASPLLEPLPSPGSITKVTTRDALRHHRMAAVERGQGGAQADGLPRGRDHLPRHQLRRFVARHRRGLRPGQQRVSGRRRRWHRSLERDRPAQEDDRQGGDRDGVHH